MNENGRLSGKRALVTGGGRGIGAAICRRLAAEGAAVAVNYRSGHEVAQMLVDELVANGHQAQAFGADVSKPDEIEGLMADVVEAFGGLDLVASNAGIEHFGPLDSIAESDTDRVFHTNVAGQLFVTQSAVRHLGRGGRLVLTSSISARIGVHHHALYAASKAAVSAMVLNLAPELAERGIAINAIAPGGTNTDMATENARHYIHPKLTGVPAETALGAMNAIGRLAEPDEIAAAVAFLLSADASYITGSTLDVSGGWL